MQELVLAGVGARLPSLLDRLRQRQSPYIRCVLARRGQRAGGLGSGHQSDAVGRTASAVEALSEKIDRISTNAEEAAQACERARDEARRGLEQVHSVIEGMDRLLAQIEANGRNTKRLEDRSNEIGVIVDLIRGISNRTDMLALNATIESVLAGEHGRRFAVVADEIRKLAERTATATREIGTIVEAIEADTHETSRALGQEQTEMQPSPSGFARPARPSSPSARSPSTPHGSSKASRVRPTTRCLRLRTWSGHATDLGSDQPNAATNHALAHLTPRPRPVVRALAATCVHRAWR